MNTTTRKARSVIAAITLTGSLITGANAAVTITPVSSPSGITFDFSSSTQFTASTARADWEFYAITFFDAYSPDIAVGDRTFGASPSAFSMSVQINSSPAISITDLTVNTGTGFSGDNGDLVFLTTLASEIDISIGDTITITGSATFASTELNTPNNVDRLVSTEFRPRFSPGASAVATNDIMVSTVPEPSASLLLGLGCLSLAFKRSRH